MICPTDLGFIRTTPDTGNRWLRCPDCGREWPAIGLDTQLPRHTKREP